MANAVPEQLPPHLVGEYVEAVLYHESGRRHHRAVRDHAIGDTRYLDHTPETALIHDLENIGNTPLRVVTVELLS